jgi:hypothetical protein
MATIELLPEEIFSEENEYLKIPDSVLDELKKYAPKNFNSLSSDNEKSLQLKNEGLEVLFNIFSRSCMISASFTDPEMSDVFVKETKEIKKIEDVFFGIEYIVFHISEKRIEKIFLEIGSVGLSDKEFNNCLINLYESYEKNRKKTLKMLKNVFNLLTYFNKKNVFEEKKRNPNVINFIKGNPEENVIIDEFIFEDYKLKVNYNLKDIRSNTLLIEYTGKKYPIVNNIKVLGIDFKKDKDNFIISKIRGKYGGSVFEARGYFNGKVNINPSVKTIYFTNEDLKLTNQSYNCGMIYIYYETNTWPLKVSGFRFDTLSLLGFINKEGDNSMFASGTENSIKDIEEIIEFKKRKFKNLSPENSLFLCFMLYENEKKVMEDLSEMGLNNNLSEIKEDDFYLFLMNNNWTLEVRKVYENLMWLCEKYLKISEIFESRLGTKKHLKKLRAEIKNKNFELEIAKFLVIDPRRPLF